MKEFISERVQVKLQIEYGVEGVPELSRNLN